MACHTVIKGGINMNKFWCSIICIGSAIYANIEINNKSAYPFKITSITYEHNNGLQKTPLIELTPLIVQPYTHMQFPTIRREPIRNISGVHAHKTYTFDLPAYIQGTITVTPDNQVRLLGPHSMITSKNPDLPPKEKNRGIRRL